jgi:Protein of unknown function (DUF2809)
MRLIAVIALGVVGYWLRFKAPISPEARDDVGGVAYVVFFVLVAAFIAPTVRASRLALTVLLVTCVLEFLQLWHPGWLERIRSTFIGRCLLGTTFGWSDFLPYFLGAILGWALLRVLERVGPNRANIHA